MGRDEALDQLALVTGREQEATKALHRVELDHVPHDRQPTDLNERLGQVPFVAGDQYSAADITALVTVDFAAKALDLSVPPQQGTLKRWYHVVSSRPSAMA